ncbi:MAG: lipocalin-like domain-containing protein [Pseudomonadota bacterium]
MNVRWFLIFCVLPWAAFAQGFAGLGADADGFSLPTPKPKFSFPEDHGPHPDYRIEWWYLTANLESEDGRDFGLQWTLFRSALSSDGAEGWNSSQVWFAHAAVTTAEKHFATERFARGGIGQAGVVAEPFHAWIDEWHMKGIDFDNMNLVAQGNDFAYNMTLDAQGPLVFHGDQGFSVKSAEGQASYYYSQPFFTIEGTLELPEGVVEVSGSAWLDREWSSQPLSASQSGWDWFSLSFDDGAKLMGFRLRQSDGPAYTASTWIEPDGSTQSFENGVFSAVPQNEKPVAGRDIPTLWRVQLPDKGVDVTVEAMNPQAWMGISIPYWEGPVRVTGSHSGEGYLEMTGYE